MKAHFCLSLCFCLLAIENLGQGQPPATGAGDPAKDFLPAAPVARLGSDRFKGFGRPFALIFSRDSKTLIVGGWEGDVVCWDLENRRLQREWPAHSGPIESLAVSPDGKLLASGGDDKEIRLWQLSTGERKLSLKGHRLEVENLAFSPDGAFLASTDPHGVALWDLANPQEYFRLDRKFFEIGVPIGFTDGSSLALLAFSEHKPTLQSVNVKTGREKARVAVPYEHGNWSDWGALSPSAKWFLQIDGSLRTLNIATRAEMRYFAERPFGGVLAVAVSPDDRFIAIAMPNRRVAVVELATGFLCGEFGWPDQRHTCFAFSPNGRYLASGSADRSVLLWDLTGRQANGKMPPIVLTAADLDQLWNDLTSGDGRVLRRAVWTLVAGARESIPYLEAKLRPVGAAPERIANLVRDLDDNNFKVRVRAESELEKLHDEAEAALKKVLTGGPVLETRRRIEKLLDLVETQWSKGHMTRGIEALERCGTPEASKVLEGLATNRFSLRRAQEAQSALSRLPKGDDKPVVKNRVKGSIDHDRGKAEWNRLIGRVKVLDARTLEFADGTQVALGLNAPEPGQQGLIDGKLYPCDKEAADFLRKLIGDQSVMCLRDLDDDVCIGCYVGDVNIKHAMVINGWALANHSSLHPAEIIARENKRGLWRRQFVTPAEWRTGKRLPGEK